MSPNEQTPGVKQIASNNLYTVLLAFAFSVVLVTAILVACKCYFQYNAVFKMP